MNSYGKNICLWMLFPDTYAMVVRCHTHLQLIPPNQLFQGVFPDDRFLADFSIRKPETGNIAKKTLLDAKKEWHK